MRSWIGNSHQVGQSQNSRYFKIVKSLGLAPKSSANLREASPEAGNPPLLAATTSNPSVPPLEPSHHPVFGCQVRRLELSVPHLHKG